MSRNVVFDELRWTLNYFFEIKINLGSMRACARLVIEY